MPGFGSNPFGEGPFGRYDWSRQVLWRDMPPGDRAADANENNRLEKWSESAQPLFEELLLKTLNFGSLRDPDEVRTRFDGLVSVTPVSSQISTNGRTVDVILDDPNPSDPLVPLGGVSVGWIFEDANGTEFKVNQVHKLDSRGPIIELSGRGTPATEEDLGAGNADAVVRPPSLISFFGSDYGITIDTHEPEEFQRSAVRNVTQWLDLKGSAKSYDILGKISGYSVTPQGLWHLDESSPDGIPHENIFELPSGSGKFYTNLAPRQPLFDEIAADVIPMDFFCFETPDWTTDNIVPPDPDGDGLADVPDGTSVEDAISFTLQNLSIVSTTDLGEGRARVRVNGDLGIVVGVGNWLVVFDGTPDEEVHVETIPVDEGGGEWSFEVVVGEVSSFSFGSQLDFQYECPIRKSCGVCRASVIRVEVKPERVLDEPLSLVDGALTRLASKIEQVVPIHVRLVEIVHIIEEAQATLDIQANASTTTL